MVGFFYFEILSYFPEKPDIIDVGLFPVLWPDYFIAPIS